jgi:hypothetical protein
MQAVKRLETKTYDPRWFIWTVVILIVSGVSLVSYILVTNTQDSADTAFLSAQHVMRQAPAKNTNSTSQK